MQRWWRDVDVMVDVDVDVVVGDEYWALCAPLMLL
jgi:hypothetical protein